MQQAKAVFKLMDSFRQEVKDSISLEMFLKVENYLNMAYAVGHDAGVSFKAHGKKVIMYRDGVEIDRFDTMLLAAKRLGVDKSRIGQCIKHLHKCKGYHFLLEK